MQKWVAVVALVLLVLAGAVGLRALTVGNHGTAVSMAKIGGEPPPPWVMAKIGGEPPPPWMARIGGEPPPPW